MSERYEYSKHNDIEMIQDTEEWIEYFPDKHFETICKLLNEKDHKIKELEEKLSKYECFHDDAKIAIKHIKSLDQELFETKVSALDERLAEYATSRKECEEAWNETFGMSEEKAKKKAGWFGY